jgi:hypothetical protein
VLIEVCDVVFQDEAREFALRRHLEQRPTHAGPRMWFEYLNEQRTELAEMLATHTYPDAPYWPLQRSARPPSRSENGVTLLVPLSPWPDGETPS